MSRAACVDSPELPWIDEHASTVGYPRRVMARICAGCPVLADCDQYAQTSDVIAGFWAGRPRSTHPQKDAGWPKDVPNPLDPATGDQPDEAADRATGHEVAPKQQESPDLAAIVPLAARPGGARQDGSASSSVGSAVMLTAAVHGALRRYERAAHVFVPKYGPVASARLRLLVAIEALHHHADRPSTRGAHKEHRR
jgi:hypothetical protein